MLVYITWVVRIVDAGYFLMSFIGEVIELLMNEEYLDVDREDWQSDYFEWNEYFSFAWRNKDCKLSPSELVDGLMQFTTSNRERYSTRLVILRNWNV